MKSRTMPTLLVLVVAIGLLAMRTPMSHAVTTSDSVIKASATAEKASDDGKQVVTITLEVDPKYHIYANPVGNEDFDSNKTSVTLGKGSKGELVKVEYPNGELIKDKVVGDYKVLKGKVTIKATVQRGKDSAVEFAVKVQACSEKACLAPATIKVKVP